MHGANSSLLFSAKRNSSGGARVGRQKPKAFSLKRRSTVRFTISHQIRDDGEMVKLMHWQPKPGTTLSTQILTEACQSVESIGGQKDGRWRSVLTFYRPIQRDTLVPVEHPRDFLGLALQEQPAKYYFILRPNRIILEADASIQVVMEKLQSYKARVTLNFEGFQYKLGDFQVRVGKCVPSTSEALRGIMMEVEYLPLSSIEKSRQVLEDFFDIWQETISKKSLPGHFMHIESNFADYGLQDRYTSHHTAVQYATCMAQLIAAVRG